MDEWIKNIHIIHTHNKIFNPKKKKKKILPFVTIWEKPGRHYAKCNKPDSERQILQDTYLYLESSKAKLI